MNIWYALMAKIVCKYHDDQNASMEVYENEDQVIGYCFTCNTRVVLEGKPSGRRKRPTDIPSVLEYIHTLPFRKIRGFDLHFDSLGYYLLWPSRDFYKRRNFNDTPRYTAPTGVKPPLYEFKGKSGTLIAVEGELNTRSLYESLGTDDTVVSPGPAGEFPKLVKVAQLYSSVILVVDHDPAGIVYGTHTKNLLLKQGKSVKLVTCTVDYNDMYCNEGPEAVKQHFKENL